MQLTSTTRKQGVFISKIGQKVPQMPPIQLDQGAILDKSFSTWPFLLGSFWWSFWFFLLDFFILFFISQQYFDNNYILWYIDILNILINKFSYLYYLINNVQNKVK
jgi:hypothetical protein